MGAGKGRVATTIGQMLYIIGLSIQEDGMAVASPAIYSEVLLLLGGAVVSAPLFKRIGLGTIFG